MILNSLIDCILSFLNLMPEVFSEYLLYKTIHTESSTFKFID